MRVTDHFADGRSSGNGVGLERRGRAPWPMEKWRWKGGTFDGEIGPWGEAAWWNGALNAELWQWVDGLGWSSASCQSSDDVEGRSNRANPGRWWRSSGNSEVAERPGRSSGKQQLGGNLGD